MAPAYSESGREGVGDMRPDPRAADLQDDLGVAGKRDGGRIAVPEVPVDVRRDRARGSARTRRGPSGWPQIANRSPSVWPVPDTSITPVGSRVTIGCSQAPDSTYGTVPTHGCRMPMPGRHEHHPRVDEQLQVHAVARGGRAPRRAAPAESTAPAVEREALPDADRPRLRRISRAAAGRERCRLTAIAAPSGRSDTGEHVRCNGTPGVAVRGNEPRRWDKVRPRAFRSRGKRRRPESNWCGRLCRPLPNHSATSPSRRQCSDGRSDRPSTSRRRTRPCLESAYGRRRRLQSQGWRRQDDDRRQRRLRARPRGSPDAPRRPRSAGLRGPVAGHRRRGRPRLERAVRDQGQDRGVRTRPTRRCSGSA